MPIIRSFGALKSVENRPTWSAPPAAGALSLYSTSSQTYAAIYRTQPNVRTVVDFLARNIAQLGIHAYRRLSDTDRERLSGHQLIGWLTRPNPATTRYRLIESLMGDLGIYFNAYWLKVRSEPLGLIRLPSAQMSVEGGLLPSAFVWTMDNGEEKRFAPSEIVYFNGYNPDPDNPLMGVSPLETLRRVLAEEQAAGEHRESFWRHSARFGGIVTRPKEKPRYNPTQVQDWREQWQAAYGQGGAHAGGTVLLQDGETFTPTSSTFKDSEFVAARKLTREECAAAFHVPLPMVGILDHATFSNIKEQHKHLYQDCLGPWLVMITEEIERQLLVECDDQRDVYIEFNIAAKLAGSFEEQATSLTTLTGKPIMKVNEARARLNLPRDENPESDEVAPQQGGPAAQPETPAAPPSDEPEKSTAVDLSPVIQATRERQRARLAKLNVSDRPIAFVADLDRWNRELSADLAEATGSHDEMFIAVNTNQETLRQLEADAMAARVAALEQREPTINVHQAPITVNLPPAEKNSGVKAITFQRDATGAMTGAAVKEL